MLNFKIRIYICPNQSITIQPNLVKVDEGWAAGTSLLNEINMMPNNPNFMCYNKQFLLSKSSPEKVIFDVLVLSVRNIKKAIIPNFIEVIKDYAFAGCMDLESVEFQPDSKLRQIE